MGAANGSSFQPGNEHPRWKGGVTVNKLKGVEYLRVSAGPQRGKYVHQLVAEAKLGRPLEPWETVEHDNGNSFDNSWNNILIVSRPENTKRMMARRKKANASEHGHSDSDKGNAAVSD